MFSAIKMQSRLRTWCVVKLAGRRCAAAAVAVDLSAVHQCDQPTVDLRHDAPVHPIVTKHCVIS